MTALDSAILEFRASAGVGELAICHIAICDGFLTISAPIEFVAGALWEYRNALKKAAIQCGFTGSILVMYEGERYGPRIDLSD